MVLLLCIVALITGIGLEMLGPSNGPRFGVITQPGGRVALGFGVVAVLVLAAHAMRTLLKVRERGEGDAVDHP